MLPDLISKSELLHCVLSWSNGTSAQRQFLLGFANLVIRRVNKEVQTKRVARLRQAHLLAMNIRRKETQRKEWCTS